ncbi:MAG TPA: anti-sigma factor [Candidatus Limnocylindria bacterium]|jgi:anti-sigma-K factor RskA|nr:anti-sigma factor [Candidatus Limnocylindria bacterium]
MSESDREAMLENVALYALGVLPQEDVALVTAFIANDVQARREYADLRAAADSLAFVASEPVDSARSARLKERLMARVREDAAHADGVRPRIGSNPAVLWAVGLAAAASLAFGIVSVIQDVGLRSDLAATQRRVSTLQSQLATTERVGAQDRQTLTDLLASDARRFDVAGGSVVVRGGHVYFTFSKLPPLPRGRVYQAWTFPKGSTVPAPSVTFTPNANGVAVVALPADATKLGAVAVTVEPDGGSKTPTTKPTFVRPLT